MTSTGRDVILDGNVTANRLIVAARSKMVVGGNVQASEVQLGGGPTPASDAVVTGSITAGSISIQPKSLLTLSPTGVLTSTGNIDLTGQKIYLDGNTTGKQITVGSATNSTVSVGGIVQGQTFTATGGSAVINGSVTTSLGDLKLTLSSAFTEGASGESGLRWQGAGLRLGRDHRWCRARHRCQRHDLRQSRSQRRRGPPGQRLR